MDHIVQLSRQLIDRGSKSFAGASRLFDPETRESATLLYAWCRHCDDVIDGQVLGHAPAGPASHLSAEQRLAILKRDTIDALEGRATEPVFIALQRVVGRHDIPARHPLELIEGFEMDVSGRSYATLEDTLTYCYHVAGVVGVMMAMIMGVRDRETLNRASDLGIAFQLTNIARDVIPDAEAGRLYLPIEWLDEAGVPHDAVADPANRTAIHRVTSRLLDTAEVYYVSARHGLPQLGFRSAWAIASARRIYRDIGHVVRQRGKAAWDERAVVSRSRKLVGVARGAARAAYARTVGVIERPPSRGGLWTKPDLGV
jgi:phytoene synthase